MTIRYTRRAALGRLAAFGGAGFAAAATVATSARADAAAVDEVYLPQLVNTRRDLPAGEIHVFPDEYFLYFMLQGGLAIRYGVGIGRPGLYEPGTFTVARKAEWPWWRPTNAMIARDPDRYGPFRDGMPGGPDNPLGARALYLYDAAGNDTFLRIHGTNAPRTIGSAVSNGCARLVNDHIIDLYPRVPIGTSVTLHPVGNTA